MSDSHFLIGIYNTIRSQNYLIHVFNDEGIVDQNLLKDLKKEIFGVDGIHLGPEGVGPFETMEELTQFAFTICDEAGADKITLYSVEDYNGLILNTKSLKDFIEELPRSGNVIENLDSKSKKGLMGKIFS